MAGTSGRVRLAGAGRGVGWYLCFCGKETPKRKPPFRGFPVFVGSVSGAYKEKKLFLPTGL